MSVIQYRKMKCDECGKTQEVNEKLQSYPSGWLEVNVTEWTGNTGHGLVYKEICSTKCALKILHTIKIIPNRRDIII